LITSAASATWKNGKIDSVATTEKGKSDFRARQRRQKGYYLIAPLTIYSARLTFKFLLFMLIWLFTLRRIAGRKSFVLL